MSAALRKPVIAASIEPISLDAHRAHRPRLRGNGLKIAAIFAICILALLGSFADSAVARTGLLLMGSGEDGAGNLDGMAMTLIWATIANVAVTIGIIGIAYVLVSRPSAEIVELRPRWRRKRQASSRKL